MMERKMNSSMNSMMTAACAGVAFCCACAASNIVILSVLGAILLASIIIFALPLVVISSRHTPLVRTVA